jgi:flagellin
MALAIATNNAALRAAASASSVNRDMETSMARLSSGKRINSASDDAAGVAISSRLSAEIRGTDQAVRNSLDGQALIDTAEGAHKEIETFCSACVRLPYKLQMTPTTIKTELIYKLK